METTSSLLLDFIEAHWAPGTKMRFIDWRKQNVVLRIHSIVHKEVNAKMLTGCYYLTGNYCTVHKNVELNSN